MLMYKVRFTESFKDGNIFGSKSYKANEVDIITEDQLTKARNSGAFLDIMETLVPNPLKNITHPDPEPVKVVSTVSSTLDSETVFQPKTLEVPDKKSRSKGKKNAQG